MSCNARSHPNNPAVGRDKGGAPETIIITPKGKERN
jgi:hypothetical protein